MKKNISINISGIIFHIEEDGYEGLRSYLDSINKFFSTYDDSSEIISDIESRIAEIFLSKLDDQKQIITLEDVNLLIETMGTIADFEAIEEEPLHHAESEEPQEKEAKKEESKKEEKKDQTKEDPGKAKLFRDEKRRVLGGVAAGMGYYFSIDPLWVRLVFVVLFLNLFVGTLSVVTFLAYIILWMVIPGSTVLGEDEHVKKMFRDSENRVLGGVASGIAAYFGIDVTIVRLLFVLSIFLGGTGIILYIIFWMITTEARTITQKMQMQGEAVTLSNIQESVKKSLKTKEGDESPFAKILLFPFRAIAALFEALAKFIGPFSKVLAEVLRIFAGAVISFAGLLGMILFILSTGIVFGLFTGLNEYFFHSDIPLGVFYESFSPFLYGAGFIVGFIPLLLLTLLGISVLAKRLVITSPIGWPMFGIWLIGIVSLGILIPKSIASFSRDGEFKETRTFEIENEPVTLRVNYVEGRFHDRKSLKIRGHEDSVFRLEVKYGAQGLTRSDAIENAQMITYGVSVEGDEMLFDSNFQYKDRAKFRNQRVEMTLFVPFDHKFVLDEEMENIITNTIARYGYRSWQITEDYTWKFTEEGLKCVNCPEEERSNVPSSDRLEYYDDEEESFIPKRYGNGSMNFDLTDFSQIDIYGFYEVELVQGDKYAVEIDGPEDLLDDVFVNKVGQTLEINFSKNKWKMLKGIANEDKIKVFISTPKLTRLKTAGLCTLKANDLDVDDLRIELTGGSMCDLDLEGDEIEVQIDGGSILQIEGRADYLDARVSGASSLKSSDFRIKYADLNVTGVSSARVNAKEKLKVRAQGGSSIRYYANPETDIDSQGSMSTIRPAR